MCDSRILGPAFVGTLLEQPLSWIRFCIFLATCYFSCMFIRWLHPLNRFLVNGRKEGMTSWIPMTPLQDKADSRALRTLGKLLQRWKAWHEKTWVWFRTTPLPRGLSGTHFCLGLYRHWERKLDNCRFFNPLEFAWAMLSPCPWSNGPIELQRPFSLSGSLDRQDTVPPILRLGDASDCQPSGVISGCPFPPRSPFKRTPNIR